MLFKSTKIVNAADAFDAADAVFQYCDFEGLKVDGFSVDGAFLSCSLTRIDWYWGLFNGCLFVDTKFKDCQFHGAHFGGCRFLNCTFENCEFGLDNMLKPCDFGDSTWYGCSATNTVGLPSLAAG
jgi:uncharacterized protein YjbI with pentapeptide repeats